MLLRDIIEQGANDRPDDVALIFRDQPSTYAELAVAVRRFAAGLYCLGIRPGDRVAILLPNCTPFVYSYFGGSMIGAVVVPANPLLKPAELEYIWRDSAIRLVVTAGPLLPCVETARRRLPELETVICITAKSDLPDPAIADSISGYADFTDVMRSGAQALAVQADAMASALSPATNENECAIIIYTSGTTGHPKGAMLSHKNLTSNVRQVSQGLNFTTNDRFIAILPLFHSFAQTVCMNTALALGCSSVLMENFVPAKALEAVERHRVTIFPGVPALLNALLMVQDREYDMSSMRVFVSGGAPLPAATLAAVEARFKVPVIEGDGPTECSPVTSVNPEHGPRKIGSVGPPLPGVTFSIVDDADNHLPVNKIGEIVVRGDNVMLGYLNQPEETALAMKGGWYHTGDLGYLDEDGYCYIVDRKKDMIITAGLNVYPREVEEVLFQHPAVANAAVIGMHDAKRGEEVLAVVVKRPGVEVRERELISYCRERLANFKTPRRVLFRDTLPMGGTGKVVKRLLKKELELESGLS